MASSTSTATDLRRAYRASVVPCVHHVQRDGDLPREPLVRIGSATTPREDALIGRNPSASYLLRSVPGSTVHCDPLTRIALLVVAHSRKTSPSFYVDGLDPPLCRHGDAGLGSFFPSRQPDAAHRGVRARIVGFGPLGWRGALRRSGGRQRRARVLLQEIVFALCPPLAGRGVSGAPPDLGARMLASIRGRTPARPPSLEIGLAV